LEWKFDCRNPIGSTAPVFLLDCNRVKPNCTIRSTKSIQRLLHQGQLHSDAILKLDQTLAGIAAVLAGRPSPAAMMLIKRIHLLRRRQRQTFRHLLLGRSEREAAKKIGVSEHTLHQHIKGLYEKFGVNSRAKLMAVFLTDVAGAL
jgi:DNA-binding CsgD family transcriptional regulator